MKQSSKENKHLLPYRGLLLINLADYTGIITSLICIVHCWIMPLVLVALPGLLIQNELIHPVLCSVAILSTLPLIFNKAFKLQSILFKVVLIVGNCMMLLILLAHDHLNFIQDLMLNTVGGVSLAYLHLVSIKWKY